MLYKQTNLGKTCIDTLMCDRASQVAQWVKNLPAMQETQETWGMATTPVFLPAWRIPWTGEPGGLQSIGSEGVGHD